MTVETTEYTRRKAFFVSGDGEVFDTAEELAAWEAEIAEALAQGEEDIATGRVMSADEAMRRARQILQSADV